MTDPDDKPNREQTLLGWDDMRHHRQPTDPKPLPHALVLQLQRILDDAVALAKNGNITPRIALVMLRALSPVVRRERWWQQQKADESHYTNFRFTVEDRKLADHIALLLTFGKEEEYSRTRISEFLRRNRTSREISTALDILRRSGRAVCRKVPSSGYKPREMWRLSRHGDFPYPLPPPGAGLPQPPIVEYVGFARRRPPGAAITWGDLAAQSLRRRDDTAPPHPRPVWNEDRAYREFVEARRRDAAAPPARTTPSGARPVTKGPRWE